MKVIIVYSKLPIYENVIKMFSKYVLIILTTKTYLLLGAEKVAINDDWIPRNFPGFKESGEIIKKLCEQILTFHVQRIPSTDFCLFQIVNYY